MSKGIGFDGVFSLSRVVEVIQMIAKVIKHQKYSDVIYITISESFFGNLKDLMIYLACYNRLRTLLIHLHGGSIEKDLWKKKRLLYTVNKFFIKKLGGVIISGSTHRGIFKNIIDSGCIHTVQNFAPNYMFISKNRATNKFNTLNPLRILYVSSLRDKKGYLDLYKSFFDLNETIKNRIKIDFAGAFEIEEDKINFLDKISGIEQMQYHGVIDIHQKTELFSKAHIFCLPTRYFEGQPISILEAYASGCAVLTTGLGGIKDIFIDRKNGYKIQANNAESISLKIEYCFSNPEELKKMALQNRNSALMKYQEKTYISSIIDIIETIV